MKPEAGRDIFITGGAGFIGSNLVATLVDLGFSQNLVVFDSFVNANREDFVSRFPNIRVVQGDVRDFGSLNAAMREFSVVVHLAALGSVPRSIDNPDETFEVNVVGTKNVARACVSRSVSQLIFASSSSVYGTLGPNPRVETQGCFPVSPYGSSKLAGETWLLSFSAVFSLPVLALRFFNVFGPGQREDSPYAAVIPRFISAGLKNEKLVVNGDGQQARDFTYVTDLCSIISRAIFLGTASPTPINAAFGMPMSLLEIVSALESAFGHKVEIEFGPARPGDILVSFADSSVMKGLFGGPKPTYVQTALRETIGWYGNRRNESVDNS